MGKMKRFLVPALLVCVSFIHSARAQQMLLDGMESADGWELILADGVEASVQPDQGKVGKALRFNYDFTRGTGYGGIQKRISLDLPEHFEISFWLRAESPANNFEIKFIDASGHNVWWVNNRNYDFPDEWQRIRIKRRHVHYAWGPTEERYLSRMDRIEFTVASFLGGKGSVWIDDLRFEPLDAPPAVFPTPKITAGPGQRGSRPAAIMDGNKSTAWQSKPATDIEVVIDLGLRREFGGLHIMWSGNRLPHRLSLETSLDGKQWEQSWEARSILTRSTYIPLREAEAVKLRLKIGFPDPQSVGIQEIELLPVEATLHPNELFRLKAKNSPRGLYPRYFLDEAWYWTVTGVNNDTHEGMISEDGVVEVDKALFSIEPLLVVDGKYYDWSQATTRQTLRSPWDAGEFAFSPTVDMVAGNVRLTVSVSSDGVANKNSRLNIGYRLENLTGKPTDARLILMLRPFQVNPWYQFLNLTGGAGKIAAISETVPGRQLRVDDKTLSFSLPYRRWTAATGRQGNIAEIARGQAWPPAVPVRDPDRLGQAALEFSFNLTPGQVEELFATVPYHHLDSPAHLPNNEDMAEAFDRASGFWADKIGHINFNLPPQARPIVDTWLANLVYILINRDNAGIQPGSRSYERSWIRDGSLTSSALLKSGIAQEVKDFIRWYAPYQYENGKVPCVVDFRGPDPVPEHDSHGQLIYLIREYFNFTGDTAFLREMNPYVLNAVRYIESLIAERSTDHYRLGNDSIRAHYGIVPESISHEGYSEKPMHSYWDNFFVIKGLKDAAEIQRILGHKSDYQHIAQVRDKFTVDLYNSIRLAMQVRGINYIPGCVELGDFDATSTTVALTPCNEYQHLPKPEVYNTFDKYFEFFVKRRDGLLEWVNYTPYENRLIGSFVLLNQPERAHQLVDFFLADRRPQGWKHWAEVVWKNHREPRFIGDMPHTWVGSDFINAIRSMFVYEDELDQSLVLAAALRQDWIDYPGGMSVENLPTYYGDVSYSIIREGDTYIIDLQGDLRLPANGIRIRNFNGGRMPSEVRINGKVVTNYTSDLINVPASPARIEISYKEQ
ncbi:MAG: discoidin domain-containing protein [Bacteroidetes bacterium]|nr:discoidin domain-containing protein [Bacteroidota bacterium]